jgi:hypothetical protein
MKLAQEICTGTLNILTLLGSSVVMYFASLYATQTLSNALSEKITSQQQLEIILKEEQQILGNRDNIEAVFSTEELGGISGITKDGQLTIGVSGSAATRNVVRHELYHIHDGHLGNDNIMLYLFLTEPQATIYSIAGIKL